MKKYLTFFACLFIITTVQATPTYTCSNNIKSFSFKNNQLILSGKNNNQRFYQLTNISNQAFWMDMAVHPGSASAGWGSQIHAGHYSIVAMTNPSFAFSCTYFDKNYQVHPLNCQKVLSVCQLQTIPQRDGKPAPQGSYWVFEDLK